MYNAAEQLVELNKTNVAQASKLAAITLENTEKLFRLNLTAAKSALAHGIENAQAAASVKDVQELFALRARFAETGVQTALRARFGSASRVLGGLGRDLGELQQGHGRVGGQGCQVGPGRLRCRRRRLPVDIRRDDRRLRSVPEGDQAGREPR